MKLLIMFGVVLISLLNQGCGVEEFFRKQKKENAQTEAGPAPTPEPEQFFALASKYVERTTYDCEGRPAMIDRSLYDCEERLLKVPSFNNIPIDRGYFVNNTNGRSNYNHSDGTGKHKEEVFVSNCDHAQTMRLERGHNVIQYLYETCGERDSNYNCVRWDFQEQGRQTFLVKYYGLLDYSCKIFPKCKDGKVTSYDVCAYWAPQQTPSVVWSDF